MITTDYIIANIDRHYNNFGFIRNADTLEFKGIAPIYDSGTSLWFNKADKMITPDKPIEAKPFKQTQEKQIKLVEKFDWLNFSALKGFEEEASAILAKSDYITDQRRTLICNGIKQNINNLKLLVLEKK